MSGDTNDNSTDSQPTSTPSAAAFPQGLVAFPQLYAMAIMIVGLVGLALIIEQPF